MLVHGTKLGTFRSYQLAIVICIAAFMQGYDSGVAGAILAFKSFQDDYHYTAAKKKTVNSLTVGLNQLGAFVACLVVYPISYKYGRKWPIMISAVIFIAGVIIQTIDTGSLAAWYVGRVVAGLGAGGCVCIVPSYSSEMAPKEIRGRLGSMYQWMYTLGIFFAYWVDYGVKQNLSDGDSAMWQIPVALQLVSGVVLLCGMTTLKESVRWLLKNGRDDEAWKSLVWIRADDSQRVLAEFDEIKAGLMEERHAKEGLKWTEYLEPANRKRFALGSAVFVFQQCTGATALAAFGPQFFQQLVGNGNQNILLTALFGVIKLVACSIFILFVSEMFRRRTLMISGALGMGTCMLITSIVLKYEPPPASGEVTAAGRATVALIFLNIACYNLSWGPLPWAYVGEIFPTRFRELGVSVSVAIHWLFSFVFSYSTPYMQASMGWGIFLFYAMLDFVMPVFVYYFVTETKDISLEGVQTKIDHETAIAGHHRQDAYAEENGSSSGDDRDAKVVQVAPDVK